MIRVFCSVVLLLLSANLSAADDIREFDTAEQKELFLELADELRCPKCQNQNIADSNASVAKDLKAKVHKLVMEGNSKRDIVDFMVERYGYFVYYKPPVNAATIVLWLLPIVFVLFTLVLIWFKARRSQKGIDKTQWTEAQEQQLNQLIAQIEQTKG